MSWPSWLSEVPERREQCGAMGKQRRTHGHANPASRTYRSWSAMKGRCDRPKDKHYRDYGGRGIAYDPRWEKFENFLADMGERPAEMTLDRIDPDGNYTKANCRWADAATQRANRRKVVKL